MDTPSEFVEGLVKSVDKEKLSNREKFLAATGIMACWTVLAITGNTPIWPMHCASMVKRSMPHRG